MTVFDFTCFLTLLGNVIGIDNPCCIKEQSGLVTVQSFAHTNAVRSLEDMPGIWCRVSRLPDPDCGDAIFFTGKNETSFLNDGRSKVKIIFKIQKAQQSQKILLTFLNDNKTDEGLDEDKIRNISRHFHKDNNYNSNINSDSVWQDVIEFNTSGTNNIKRITETINTKDHLGSNIVLVYTVDLEIIEQGCATGQTSSGNATAAAPSSTGQSISRRINRTTLLATTPLEINDYSRTSTGTTIQWNGSSVLLIKLQLEKEVNDAALKLDPVDATKIKHKCEILAKLADCTRCQIEVLKLQKTHLPIKLTKAPRRSKRQSASKVPIGDVMKSFFQAMPHDVKLLPTGSANIIGKKADDNDSNGDDKTILLIVFAVIAGILLILLVLGLLQWMKDRRERAKEPKKLVQDQQPIKDAERDTTPNDVDIHEPNDEPDDNVAAESFTVSEGLSIIKVVPPEKKESDEMKAVKVADSKEDVKIGSNSLKLKNRSTKTQKIKVKTRSNKTAKTNKKETSKSEPIYIVGSSAVSGFDQADEKSKSKSKSKNKAAIEKLGTKETAEKLLEKETPRVKRNEYEKVDQQYFNLP